MVGQTPATKRDKRIARREVNTATVPGSTLLQPQTAGLLFCCVCREENTTYRYEVVYRSTTTTTNNGVTIQQENFISQGSLTRRNALGLSGTSNNTVTRTLSPRSLDSVSDSSSGDDHEYYNFPPRHPRHGHLKWPVLPHGSPGDGTDQCVTLTEERLHLTYPDYPVHIPTTTLRRIIVNASPKKSKKVKRKTKARKDRTNLAALRGLDLENSAGFYECKLIIHTPER
ncbi:hypothetical protein TCAL_16405 [Tigriopus californicus]|uniref:Uncharacterized protein n=1 Tax=Tigriopus californicus TaxID=6832 RepID=A0A553NYC1_TIGCA|nr:hypothetical protein TCAL_16405 [Tigriopus californicus]